MKNVVLLKKRFFLKKLLKNNAKKLFLEGQKNIEDLKSILTPIKIKIHEENIIKIVNKTSSIN